MNSYNSNIISKSTGNDYKSEWVNSNKRHFVYIYIILLVLVLVDRFLILQYFGFHFIDDDQSIMWFGAKEISQFRIHEPFFYGQNYNPMLESLIAAPLYKLGIPINIALPITTSFMALFPYISFSILLLLKDKKVEAIVVLSILLLLPHEFAILTTISRGFVSGVFVSGLAIMSLFFSSKKKYFAFAFFSALAFTINPNALIVLVPIAFYLLTTNYKQKNLYIYSCIGIIIPVLFQYFSKKFYIDNPNYLVHRMWPLSFSIKDLSIKSKYFSDVTPLFFVIGNSIFLIMIAIASILFYQKSKKECLSMMIGFAFIVFTLGVNKVNDGYDTLFYSWSRMFIGIPFLLAFFISKIKFNIKQIYIFALVTFTSLFFVFKVVTVKSSIVKNVDIHKNNNVAVGEIKTLRNTCTTIKNLSDKYQVSLVVVSWEHFVAYGCPCLISSFPATIEPTLDKRTWRLREEETMVRENILLVGNNENSFDQSVLKSKKMIKIQEKPYIYICLNNQLKTSVFLDSLHFSMRPH